METIQVPRHSDVQSIYNRGMNYNSPRPRTDLMLTRNIEWEATMSTGRVSTCPKFTRRREGPVSYRSGVWLPPGTGSYPRGMK